MHSRNEVTGWAAVAIGLALASNSWAEPPQVDPVTGAIAEVVGGQKMIELSVRVVDADGHGVAKARLTPWALRSSQGHGPWRADDKRAGVGPKDVFTDATGAAAVEYPYYRDAEEQIRTTSVSVSADHPDFAYVSGVHIDVPQEADHPHEVKLAAGVPVEVRPTIAGQAADLENLFSLWSDGRSWQPGAAPQKTAEGNLRIPAMPPGDNSVLLVKLDGDRATHFSKVTAFKLGAGQPKRLDVPLEPAVRVRGALGDNVPRPVRNGRLKVWTLDPTRNVERRVTWWTWAPVRDNGTFELDWPAGEPLQVIALCDGFCAASGRAPECVKDAPDPKQDPFCRPQVFEPQADKPIVVAMSPLVRCEVTAVDEDESPVAGISVASWPNVGWWNSGSQVYCWPLARGERALRERDYEKSLDEAFPQPFQGETDARGRVTLEIPAGNEQLTVASEVYELPVFLGRRDVRIKLVPGETTEQVLRLQPRGTEKLGEWDKLAGVVFGCSTREGRRICALPGVQKQMAEFARRFRDAKNRRDPQLLAEAYAAVADAFVGVGDHVEAAKWRHKAAEQAEKAKAAQGG
jgi:hypothetical protein